MSEHDAGVQGAGAAQRWRSVMMDNYGTPPLRLVRGRGAQVWDDAGNEYLDLVAGIAVNALGHAHPAVVAAVNNQIMTLGHTSNLVINDPALELAEHLVGLLGAGRPGEQAKVFFCNSGAEANEAAFKLARLTGRTGMVAAQQSFHGRTMGSLALTGQPAKSDPFRPLPGDVTFVPFGDPQALAAAVDHTTAAVILEPIQGEAGVIPAPHGYLAQAQQIARAAGALLILDEVQTGVGRTGWWFAHQAPQAGDVRPDVVTLAKGLGGGLPIGATVAFGPAADMLGPGSHGSTFGGNPVSCAAALAVIRTIADEGLLDWVRGAGAVFTEELSANPAVASVRGAGLMLGVVLHRPIAKQVEVAARTAGILVNAPAADVLRLVPPLVITADQVKRACGVLAGVIAAVDQAWSRDFAVAGMARQ